MKLFDKTLLKFLMVGIINTVVGATIMFLLYNLAHCSYWFSSACNYVTGGIVSYILNKRFTFKNNETSFAQILLFAANIAVCYVVAYKLARWGIYTLFAQSTQKVKDNIALFCGMIVYTALNYLVQRYIVFRKKEKVHED